MSSWAGQCRDGLGRWRQHNGGEHRGLYILHAALVLGTQPCTRPVPVLSTCALGCVCGMEADGGHPERKMCGGGVRGCGWVRWYRGARCCAEARCGGRKTAIVQGGHPIFFDPLLGTAGTLNALYPQCGPALPLCRVLAPHRPLCRMLAPRRPVQLASVFGLGGRSLYPSRC